MKWSVSERAQVSKSSVKISFIYIGTSLLAPLRNAEREINRAHKLELRLATHNFGSPLSEQQWREVETDLSESEIVFVIHVMDGENASRLIPLLARYEGRHRAVIVFNCMPELMKRIRMGKLDLKRLFREQAASHHESRERRRGYQLLSTVGSWVGKQAKTGNGRSGARSHQYLKLVDRLPNLLRFVPTAGAFRDVKHYLYLFAYFLQPTPENVRSILLYSLKHYAPSPRLKKIKIPQPERSPSVAIYHPDASTLFESFAAYRKWYTARRRGNGKKILDPASTIGLLLMRPQVVSKTTQHYDGLVRALENEGLSVIPAIATLMDNRQACEQFFVQQDEAVPRISQLVSLTGFSFVGGPAMNDSVAAANFLKEMNRPYRSAVSLDTQSVEAWNDSFLGLNPMQAGMQIAIPEIDGATEPFVYGGIRDGQVEPLPIADRCERLARRVGRWNKLRNASRSELKIALTLFCFPPNKGNVGTAADLDVFPSLWEILRRLEVDGYNVDLPPSVDKLRERLLGGNADKFGAAANVAYRMPLDEYRASCEFVSEIERDWGPAPGRINVFGRELLIQGLQLGNVFVGIQPTFGYEGDPMRLLMAKSGAPHHGFMAFYVYLSQIFKADAVVHVGTHGSLEFMPGKQLGLSSECWPDRLIGELPNIYLYSVNNPSEGSIAKRRSYAELISYLTPPIENAGLYRELSALKDLVTAYRQSADESERDTLFAAIESASASLNFESH